MKNFKYGLLIAACVAIAQIALGQSANYNDWTISASQLTAGKLVVATNQPKTFTFTVTAVRPSPTSSVTFNFNLVRLPAGSQSCGCTALSANGYSITTEDFAEGENFVTKTFSITVNAQSGSSLTGAALRNNDKLLLAIATGSGPWAPNKTYSVTVLVPPGIPTNLTASNITPTSVKLAWGVPTGTVTGYRIYKNDVLIQTTTATNYTVNGLFPGTNYNFKVSAYNSDGESLMSSINATTAPNPITGNTISFPVGYNPNLSAPAEVPLLTGSTPQGTPSFTYQWQVKTGGTWIDIFGATAKNYDPPTATESTQYRRVVNTYDFSNILTVTFYPPITNNTICCSQTVNNPNAGNPLTGTTPSGGGPQLTVCWESSTDQVTWSSVFCAPSSSNQYSLPSGQSGVRYYRRAILDITGKYVSSPVQITFVNSIPLGSNFGNPLPLGTYSSNDCSYVTSEINSMGADFSNVYGDSRKDVFFYFQVTDPTAVRFGFRTCDSDMDTKLYLFDGGQNLISSAENGTDLAIGCGSSSNKADFVSAYLLPGLYYLIAEGSGNLKLNTATIAYGDCVDSYLQQYINPTGGRLSSNNQVEKIGQPSEDVSVFPNPTSGTINIAAPKGSEVSIYDALSMTWAQLKLQSDMIDLSNLKKGIYLIKIKSKNSQVVKRIVKE